MNKKMIVFVGSIVLFLIGIYICNEVLDSNQEFNDMPVVKVETNEKKELKEKMIIPVKEEVHVERGFYDQTLSDDDKEKTLVYFEGVYRPNDGIDYTFNNQEFDVYAVLSGTVERKEVDPLLGQIITINHGNNVSTTYSSVANIAVEKGDEVKQGQIIATCGTNVYQSDLKKHLHFMLVVGEKAYNPIFYFDKTLDEIK